MSSLLLSAATELKSTFSDVVALDVDMAKISNWRIGGRLRALVTPRTAEELSEILVWIDRKQLPKMIIGNTTNLLFNDEVVDTIAIKLGSNFSKAQVIGEEVVAQAGIYVPCLARRSMQHNLIGLEHTIGIPGTLGGLVTMNGGSQRKSIADSIKYIKAISYTGETISFPPEKCDFSYRKSIFQNTDYIITEVCLGLKRSYDQRAIRSTMLNILRERSRKFPRKLPNCGSVFVSDPAMYDEFGPPGKIIENCGFKGVESNGAQVSPIHANFIVNNGGATAQDVIKLINLIREKVYRDTGHIMRVEAKFVDRWGKINNI